MEQYNRLKLRVKRSEWYQVPAYRLVARAAWAQRSLFATVAVIGGLSAFFEGVTFGFLAFALDILSNRQSASILTNGGFFAVFVEGWALSSVFILVVVLIAVCQILRSITSVGSSLLNTILASNIAASIQRMILEEVLRLDFASASRFKAGELTAHITGHGEGVANACRQGLELLINIATMAAYIIVLCSISPLLFVMTIALFSVIVFFQKLVTRKIRGISLQLQEHSIKLSRRIVESVNALRLIHSYHTQHSVFRQVTQLQDAFISSLLSLQKRMALISPISDSIMVFGMGSFLLGGFFLFRHDQANLLPSLLTFIAVLNRLSMRVSTGFGTIAGIQSQLARLRIVDELFEEKKLTYTRLGGQAFDYLKREIRFDHVSLVYPGRDKPALTQVSFSLPKGKMIALVGGSGSGKSSLADLLLGLFEPTAGQIMVDGHPLHQIDPSSWRSKIGVVSQDTILFNATIYENIAFASSDASREQVIHAIKLAHAEEFIENLPQGLDTVIGERGFMLSGGQRQRLAIARALVRKPEILILDEATSALDTASESAVQKTIDGLDCSVTRLVVAHRLSTVAAADVILVLEKGQIAESGNHQQLIEKNGFYAKSWKNQTEK